MEPDALVIADRTFTSRLIVGTGKYSSHQVMSDAHAASATEIWESLGTAGFRGCVQERILHRHGLGGTMHQCATQAHSNPVIQPTRLGS
jgi:hypothetical protein